MLKHDKVRNKPAAVFAREILVRRRVIFEEPQHHAEIFKNLGAIVPGRQRVQPRRRHGKVEVQCVLRAADGVVRNLHGCKLGKCRLAHAEELPDKGIFFAAVPRQLQGVPVADVVDNNSRRIGRGQRRCGCIRRCFRCRFGRLRGVLRTAGKQKRAKQGGNQDESGSHGVPPLIW